MNRPDIQAPTDPAAPASRDGANRHAILIAEDNPTNQEVIVEQLQLLGHDPDIANDGVEAFERWRERARGAGYALLLTDLHMPRMDGYGLVAAIRAEEARAGRGRRTVIVAVTANAMKGEDERCKAAGMDDYLSKPVGLRRLEAVVNHWLERVGLAAPEAAPAPPAEAGPPVFVAREIERYIGSKPEVVLSFLRKFQTQLPISAREMTQAQADGRIADLGALAHRLKSSSRTVGALALAGRCDELEAACRAGGGVDSPWRTMQTAVADTAAALARHLGAAVAPRQDGGDGKA